jgi:uncharacterized protein (DUF58 family)
LALTAFTILLVLIFKNHLLVYTAVLFATVNALLFIWSFLSTRGLTVERRHSGTCLRGYPLNVELVIHNLNRAARFALVGFDDFAPAGEEERYREVALLSIGSRSTATVRYEVVPTRRGHFEIGPFLFYSGDPFGFFRHVRRVNTRTDLLVMPTPLDTYVNYLKSVSLVVKDELSTIPMPGSSTEFLGVREYQQGDPLRKVHWASTARLGTLITKQFERNVASTLSVLLVKTSRSHYYFSFLELNGTEERYSSGLGQDYFQRLSMQLAEITPGERLDLSAAGGKILRYLPSRSDLIVFIPYLTGTVASFLANLRLNYRLLSVITFDLESFRQGKPQVSPKSRVRFGQNFIIFELVYGDDLVKQLEAFVEKVGFVK